MLNTSPHPVCRKNSNDNMLKLIAALMVLVASVVAAAPPTTKATERPIKILNDS